MIKRTQSDKRQTQIDVEAKGRRMAEFLADPAIIEFFDNAEAACVNLLTSRSADVCDTIADLRALRKLRDYMTSSKASGDQAARRLMEMTTHE